MTPPKPSKPAGNRRRRTTAGQVNPAAEARSEGDAELPMPRKGTFAPESPGSRGASALETTSREDSLIDPTSKVALLAQVPAEEVWLQDLESERTRKAYQNDVRDFIAALGIRSSEELYAVTPAAVIAWRRQLESGRGLKKSTVLRKLSALSSLFQHLVEQHLAETNPVKQVRRPKRRNRDDKGRPRGLTASFSQEQARALLDAPPTDTLAGLRDRAILSVGLQVGARRAEIAHMTVGDIHQHRGLPCIRYVRKGDEDHRVPLNPQTEKRIRDYLAESGHGGDPEAPLFRPLRGNQVTDDETRHMTPDLVDKVLRKWVTRALGFTRGFSAHSMRATFITRALENGCSLERVQKDVGHAHPSTTQLYDHRDDNPEESATFFATY